MSNADQHMDVDEDEYLYGETIEERNDGVTVSNAKSPEQASEESDDSDIEFIIETKPGERAEPLGGSIATLGSTRPSAKPQVEKTAVEVKTTEPQDLSTAETAPKVDIDAVPTIDGKNIFEIDLESFDDKPWRKPGADISDYFNYGFDEFTWAAYCAKQTTLRDDFSPQKFMASLAQIPGPLPSGNVPSPAEFQAMMASGFPPFMPIPPPIGGPQEDMGYSRNFPVHASSNYNATHTSGGGVHSGAATPNAYVNNNPSSSRRESESPANSPNITSSAGMTHAQPTHNPTSSYGNGASTNYNASRPPSNHPHSSNYPSSSRRKPSPDRYSNYSSRGSGGRYRRNRY
ncbi:Pre-mRNA polyadenylation factor fip1 [Schizosaccharomyces pombe]